MSKGNTTETDFLAYLFKATAISWAAATDLYIALHTGDPGEAGTQLTSECAYTSYARVAVVRSAVGWTVAGNQSSNAALVQLPQCTGGSETITHISIGTAGSGAGQIYYKGALAASLAVSNLIQPQFAPGAIVVTED